MAKLYTTDYGHVLKMQIFEGDTKNAKDISTYTAEITARKPSGREVTYSASFVTDGKDGYIKYVFTNSDLDESGTWYFAGRINKTGVQISTEWTSVEVGESMA